MATEKKAETLMLETQLTNDEIQKPIPTVEKQDYSGAHEVCRMQSLPHWIILNHMQKTDPREIALVKKLDRWIMVCLLDSTLYISFIDAS